MAFWDLVFGRGKSALMNPCERYFGEINLKRRYAACMI
jgi:hypothetical protein